MNLVCKILLMIFSTGILVGLFVPLIKKIAIHINAMDIPNERKVHKVPIPRLGGLAIFMGLLFGYMVFGEQSTIMNSILIASFVIVITGMIDDINPIPAKYKMIGQLIAALIVVFYGGVTLSHVDAFGIYIEFGIFSIILTIFFILGCINCINLIDGLDGLAGGISAIYFLTIGVIATVEGSTDLDFVLSFVMVGSCLGFLVHNFNPAKIFMGDSGSMLLGLIIAVVALLGFKNVTMTSLIIPLLILSVPILDTLFAIIRRKLKGEKISTPDKMHIHHQLLKRNLSQKATVLIIYLVDLLFAFASLVYVLGDRIVGYIVYGILMLLVLIFVSKTDVVFEHKSHKKDKK